MRKSHDPQVDRYGTHPEDLDSVDVASIASVVKSSCKVVIDEIGPTELCSEKFQENR